MKLITKAISASNIVKDRRAKGYTYWLTSNITYQNSGLYSVISTNGFLDILMNMKIMIKMFMK